jgi:hypothetical protein
MAPPSERALAEARAAEGELLAMLDLEDPKKPGETKGKTKGKTRRP